MYTHRSYSYSRLLCRHKCRHKCIMKKPIFHWYKDHFHHLVGVFPTPKRPGKWRPGSWSGPWTPWERVPRILCFLG